MGSERSEGGLKIPRSALTINPYIYFFCFYEYVSLIHMTVIINVQKHTSLLNVCIYKIIIIANDFTAKRFLTMYVLKSYFNIDVCRTRRFWYLATKIHSNNSKAFLVQSNTFYIREYSIEIKSHYSRPSIHCI